MPGVRRKWVESGGYERKYVDGKGEVPDEEWIGFVKRFGGVGVNTGKRNEGRREVWVVSRL